MQERGGRDDVAGAAADLDDDARGVEREAGAPLLREDVDEKEAVLRDANAEGVAGGGWVRAGRSGGGVEVPTGEAREAGRAARPTSAGSYTSAWNTVSLMRATEEGAIARDRRPGRGAAPSWSGAQTSRGRASPRPMNF